MSFTRATAKNRAFTRLAIVHALLVVPMCLVVVVRAEEPVKTSSRIFALIDEKGLSTKVKSKLESLAKAANNDLVPAIRTAKSLEVLSLDPDNHPFPKGTPLFHGYRILGRVLVEPGERLQTLKASLITGIAPSSTGLLCYSPRHGIRLDGKMGIVDLEICFECVQSRIYGISSPQPTSRFTFAPRETEDLLNEVLDEAKIERDIARRKKRTTE